MYYKGLRLLPQKGKKKLVNSDLFSCDFNFMISNFIMENYIENHPNIYYIFQYSEIMLFLTSGQLLMFILFCLTSLLSCLRRFIRNTNNESRSCVSLYSCNLALTETREPQETRTNCLSLRNSYFPSHIGCPWSLVVWIQPSAVIKGKKALCSHSWVCVKQMLGTSNNYCLWRVDCNKMIHPLAHLPLDSFINTFSMILFSILPQPPTLVVKTVLSSCPWNYNCFPVMDNKLSGFYLRLISPRVSFLPAQKLLLQRLVLSSALSSFLSQCSPHKCCNISNQQNYHAAP